MSEWGTPVTTSQDTAQLNQVVAYVIEEYLLKKLVEILEANRV